MQFTKENLQDFIANYPTTFSSLADNSWQQAYIDGIKEVLADLEAAFLDNPHVDTTLDSYLENDELIDQGIQQAKVNLAKMKPLIAQMKSLSKEDSDKWKQQLQAISVPGFPIF